LTDRGEESPATAQAGAKPKRKVVRKVKKGSNAMTEAEKKAEAPAESGDAAAKATKDKGPVGYHYWHQQANQGTAPKAAPVKLSEEEADKLAKQMSGTGVGLSSWNKAGTWEERGHTDWAKARVEEERKILKEAHNAPGVIEKIEAAIAVLEGNIEDIDERLMEAGADVSKAQEIQVERDAKASKMQLYYDEWERLEEVLSRAEEIKAASEETVNA